MSIRKANGFALIDLLFVCGMMGILCSIAAPRLLMAKQSAGAASAIGSLRSIHSSQLTYALTCGGGFYAPNLTALGRAPVGSKEGFVSANLATGNTVTRSGYTIEMIGTAYPGAPSSCNGVAVGAAAQAWKASADPTDSDNFRYFATNVNGSIFEHSSSLMRPMPEVGEPGVGRVLR